MTESIHNQNVAIQQITFQPPQQVDNVKSTVVNKPQQEKLTAIIQEHTTAKFQGAERTSIPVIPEPGTTPTSMSVDTDKKMDASTLLMAQLIELLGDNEIDSLKMKAEIANIYNQSLGNAAENGLKVVEQQQQQLQQAEDTLNNASEQVQNAAENEAKLQTAVDTLNKKLTSLNEEYAQAVQQQDSGDNSPELQQQIQKLDKEMGATEKILNVTTQKLQQVQTALAAATAVETSAQDAVSSLNAEISNTQDAIDRYTLNARMTMAIINGDSSNDSQATMTLLMAQLSEILADSAEETLKTNLEFGKKLNAAQQDKLESDSEEYDKQVEEQKQAQENMSCITKVVTAIVTVVSVVAAAVTGGASLAFAAVSLGVMVADKVVKVTTGTSFIAEALKPIMEHVIMPMFQAVMNVIDKVLEGMGIDGNVGQILSAILTVVVMVAVVVAIGAVAKKIPMEGLKNALGKVFDGAIGKALGAVKNNLDDFLKPVSDLMRRMVKTGTEAQVKSLTNKLRLLESVMHTANSGVKAGFGIAIGDMQKKAADISAGITEALFDNSMVMQFMDQMIESYQSTMSALPQLVESSQQAQRSTYETSRAILQHMNA